ncbi:hypothetical protein K7X08_034794 [Anisodus acutangulus]|uniref:Calmodulin binding protein central domain-containing protein n=1 Tax=Anisodus acutangulus TaxID=402998 RepID=A0A9Q1LJS4_9SOLA|nr:hypothetical protein K7X08_034794 [Anisodus acutangulus]
MIGTGQHVRHGPLASAEVEFFLLNGNSGRDRTLHSQGSTFKKLEADFLIELHNNPQRLRRILGKSMSHDSWNTATRHAMTCNLDGRKYLYYHMETEQKVDALVVFNVAGQAYAHKLVETAFANWENVLKFDSEISIMDHISSSKFSPSSCIMVDDFQRSDQLQLTSTSHFIQRTAESNQWVVSAECSTSYAIVGQHTDSDGMSLDIPAHTTTPNQITSVNSDAEDYLKKFMQFLNSDELQLQDSPYGEPGQANHSAAETSATQCNVYNYNTTIPTHN